MNRHRAHDAVDAFEFVDSLFGNLAVHQRDQLVADLEQLSGTEAPFIVAAHKERVLERGLDAAIDQVETIVFAMTHDGDSRFAERHAVEAPGRVPFVLCLERSIDLETWH